MRKVGIGHVYDIMESVSDAGGTAGNRHSGGERRRWYVSGICGAAAVCV